MIKNRLILVSLALFSLVAFQACRKKGCTDQLADNYEDEAKKDDGSCEYTAKVVFWYDQATEDSLFNSGYSSSSLIFKVDGKSVVDDFGDTDHYFDASAEKPECPSGFFAYTENPYTKISLGNEPKKTVQYTVTTTSGGSVLFSGSAVISGGVCNGIEVQF